MLHCLSGVCVSMNNKVLFSFSFFKNNDDNIFRRLMFYLDLFS